jgi:hypothetical protein
LQRENVVRIPFVLLSLTLICGAFPGTTHGQSFGERDTGFDIDLARQDTPPFGLIATLVTTSTYPCEGYTLRSFVTWENDTVSIRVTGLRTPTPCYGMASEARGTAFLGLPPDTVYLRIYYRGDADLHRVTTGGRRLSVTPVRSGFTRVSLHQSSPR